MANVFISHSSIDKPLVRRLATSLLAEGIPVWLDTWELGLGDSLLDKIYSGIETSGALLLAMSKNSSASGWVNRELNAALAKEQQVGRTFVVPLRLDDCAVPLKVADRLYGDFSAEFSAPLAVLVQVLKKMGLHEQPVAADRELLPLSFTRQIHLDRASFVKSVDNIRRRQRGNVALAPGQVVVNDDPEFLELGKRLHGRIDNIATDRWFTPELESFLKSTLAQAQHLDRMLREGVALLVNNKAGTDSVYWFAHFVRAQAVRALWASQAPGEDALRYGESVPTADISNNHAAMDYYGSSDLVSAVIWATEEHVYSEHAHNFYVPRTELKDLLTSDGAYLGPVRALDAVTYPAYSRYMLPQVVYRAVRDQTKFLPWSISDAWVGLQ